MINKMSEETPVRSTAQNMKRRMLVSISALVIGAVLALLLTSSFAPATALATAGSDVAPMTAGYGITQTPVASGVLHDAVRMKFKQDGGFGSGLDVSNVAIVKNTIIPGGYFGWHQHSGPSWIVMTQGTLTFYDADDTTCTGHPVSAGTAFFDAGNHTHNARNETNQMVENYVVRMLPAGGAPRVDEPDPGVCPGLP